MNFCKIIVGIKKLRDNAIIPTYKHLNDAGADVYVSNIKRFSKSSREFEEVNEKFYTLSPFETIICGVGFSVEIPEGFQIEVRPTSGNSLKTPLRVANAPGTIDSNYRGEICVIIQNNSLNPWVVNEGDKIAQLIISSALQIKFVENFLFTETERGSSGFGSTGVAGDKK